MDLWSVWNLVLFIIGFGSLIFVHELGHFLVAKWVGVKVTQFAIGFGHAVLCYRKGIGYRVGSTEPEYHRRIEQHVRDRRREQGHPPPSDSAHEQQPGDTERDDDAEAENGSDQQQSGGTITRKELEQAERELGLGETEYRLNWMPFGGYVKMVGQEDLDPKAVSDDPRAFNNKPIWARMCVISAGVIMNAVFAVLFFMVAFMVGVAFPPAIIGSVSPGSPAATVEATDRPDVVGLEAGDRVVAIDGEPTQDFIDLRIASALARPGQTLHLTVERPQPDGTAERLEFALTPEEDADQGLLHIGVAPAVDLKLPERRLPAGMQAMGLEPGMRLVAVDGEPVAEHWQYRQRLEAAEGRSVELTFERGETQRTITIQPRTGFMQDEPERPHLLGLQPTIGIAGVQPGSPAEGKLEAGDVLASVDGVAYPRDIPSIVEEAGRRPIPLRVLRDGELHDVEVAPSRGRLGIALRDMDSPVIRGTLPDTPFGELDLPAGTRLLEIEGESIESLSGLRAAIQHADADRHDFEITYRLPVGEIVETQSVTLSEQHRAALADLGWTDDLAFLVLQVPQQTSNPLTAIAMGVEKTHSFLVQTYITINRLFVGTVRVEHLRGPVGIVDEGTRFAERGLGYLLFFLGLISINLAVINFLPLPIVDGGLALLLLWEKIRGKPAPPEVQSALTVMGLLLIGALFITVTFYDVARLFQ